MSTKISTMVKIPTGEKKKLLILNTFKTLFYEKGYHQTTYEDICRKADIPPGSITYHVKSKKHVAALIHSEYETNGKNFLINIAGNTYDMKTMAALRIIHWWDRVFFDPHIRRFCMDIAEEGIPRISISDYLEQFYLLYIRNYNLEVSNRKMKFIVSSHIGIVDQLLLYVCDNISEYTYKETSAHIIECYFKFLNLENNEINRIIEESNSIYETLPINNRYFEYFRYEYPEV